MLKIAINTLLTSIIILIANIAQAANKEISITIDDLPFVGRGASINDIKQGKDRFNLILQALISEQVPATGFVIAGSIAKGQWQLLEKFKQEGFTIGNHTYTHPNLNEMDSEQYIQEIEEADKRLSPLMSEKKYFRYPYLAEGHGEIKKAVKHYLNENQYIIAPVTIDSKDFRFNMQLLSFKNNRAEHLAAIKKQYLNYIWKQTEKAEKIARGKPVKQILLLHANLLNSHVLGDVIQLYKEHGYRFISLDEALTPNEAEPIEATVA